MNPATEPIRIAVCGGPYSNPYALAAFVEDARSRGCDQLYCLGDLGGFGAEINELHPILEAAEITCIAGNYDVAIARGDPDCGCGYRDPLDNEFAQLIYDHTLQHTNPEFARFMGTLPTERREQIGGCDVHFLHGSTLAINDFWWESLPEAEHELRVTMSGADLICCTHSGLPWQKQIGSTLVVNVGVIGKPPNDGKQGVWYAIIELADGRAEAELVPLAYDWQAQAASMRQAGIPEAFVETIETGWWTTCLEVLPAAERSRGRYHLYKSTLPKSFVPVGGSWGDDESGVDLNESLPVVPLFGTPYFPRRLWLYSNYHCNLKCDYCAVGSSPRALPRTMPGERFRGLVDEAVAEDFTELYVTGGEPLLHPEITELLVYATSRLPTVLLTNAMLFRGTRLERFRQLAGNRNLVVQTSIDGARAETHDAHRGRGSFVRTLEGVSKILELGLSIRVAMTETAENTNEIDALWSLLQELGVAPEGFVVRPMLRRGFSGAGLDIASETTVPELTMTMEGAFWHPAGADGETSPDMLVATGRVPLFLAKQFVIERFFAARLADGSMPQPYRCAV